MGKPIPVPRIAEPSDEDVSRYLQRFIDALAALYEAHKHRAPGKPVELHIY